MPKRTHDGAESAAKVARRTGVLESLPTELIEMLATYSGAQACTALAQTCRWMAAFLHEPARRRRLEDAHTSERHTEVSLYSKTMRAKIAVVTSRWLPSGYRHGVEELREAPSGYRYGIDDLRNAPPGLLRYRERWNNGFPHGRCEYWRKDGSLHWVYHWQHGRPVRFQYTENDGTETLHEGSISYGPHGSWHSLRFETWKRMRISLAERLADIGRQPVQPDTDGTPSLH